MSTQPTLLSPQGHGTHYLSLFTCPRKSPSLLAPNPNPYHNITPKLTCHLALTTLTLTVSSLPNRNRALTL